MKNSQTELLNHIINKDFVSLLNESLSEVYLGGSIQFYAKIKDTKILFIFSESDQGRVTAWKVNKNGFCTIPSLLTDHCMDIDDLRSMINHVKNLIERSPSNSK